MAKSGVCSFGMLTMESHSLTSFIFSWKAVVNVRLSCTDISVVVP